ncbi:MAG TPA: rhodanese-like domain-containing protein [Steroidobacteraceae bacterium]|nr:rhodanese-like domain-containing protein [Steroidobacteraceae bacterium]
MDRLIDYFTNEPLLAGGLVLMTFIVLGYEIRQRIALASAVAPNEAIRLVNSGAVLVDLRSANQFKDGHIAGAKNLPGDQLSADPGALGKLAAKTVVLYCGDGAATAAAQRTLERAGVKDVFGLRGGLAAWTQENLPVIKG